MDKNLNRRHFVKTAAIGGMGLGLAGNFTSLYGKSTSEGKKVGIIGLDTSHSVAYTKTLNAPDAGAEYCGYKIVAAYPKGSSEIKSSYERIPGYIDEVKKFGVEIVNSIDELISKVDVVLLETNDGRLHREQALPVLKAGKKMFIDKPIAATLADAIAIFDTAKQYNVPVFSSSSLRYISGMDKIQQGVIGKVVGADAYSPAHLEKTHSDIFWYGIHGVETLFAIMGTGCKSVSRTFTENTDFVVGVWNDNRIGTFRGIRSGKGGYGGIAFGEKDNLVLGNFEGYNPLLIKIIDFFNTGVVPVASAETLEICAFMEAAQESKLKKGASIEIESVMAKAKKKQKN